jgi:hypothetical protein
MAFYYGLVSQRGPWRETQLDLARLTTPYQPQFLQGIENVNTDLITHPVPGHPRDGVGSELPAVSPFNGIGNPVNGVTNTLGITEDGAIAFAQKVSSPEFLSGEDGEGVTGFYQAVEIAQELEQSNAFPWIGNLKGYLNQRFNNEKHKLGLDEIQLFNTIINKRAFSTDQMAIMNLMEQMEKKDLEDYEYPYTAEEARAKLFQQFPNNIEDYLFYKSGNQVIKSPADQATDDQYIG